MGDIWSVCPPSPVIIFESRRCPVGSCPKTLVFSTRVLGLTRRSGYDFVVHFAHDSRDVFRNSCVNRARSLRAFCRWPTLFDTVYFYGVDPFYRRSAHHVFKDVRTIVYKTFILTRYNSSGRFRPKTRRQPIILLVLRTKSESM